MSATELRFTSEQAEAITRRDGNLLLDAGAGSGKTTVLVQRFVESVRVDGIEIGRMLTITFTEKAAAELRERIRLRLRDVGLEAQAREADVAWISTIHGFCARLLRIHALRAGLDPEFTVLDAIDAEELSSRAFDRALAQSAETDAGAELIATYGIARLRVTITSLYAELRSRGQLMPALPACAPVAGDGMTELEQVLDAATAVLLELGQVTDPGVRVSDAMRLLAGVGELPRAGLPWPGEFDRLRLGNGATSLKTAACDRYRDALEALRGVASRAAAAPVRDALDALLAGYGDAYADAKRARSAVDFEDLELLALGLLRDDELAAIYRERFLRVMVDEMQDTNAVQLELIDRIAAGNVFMVGDAQQSIYAFRHADVELFAARGGELEAAGARRSLRTNFRSRGEILEVINSGFSAELGEDYMPLVAGREDPAVSGGPPVELIVVDRAADFEDEGAVAPWRLAEARALARRIRDLIDAGDASAGEIVVLTRATTDLTAYERALAEAAVPTYVIGGRGYWQQQQVLQLVAYLRVLVNPLDQDALHTVLLSPLCGLSLDGLVLVAAAARDELSAQDSALLTGFEAWIVAERGRAARVGVEALLDRALSWSGYERALTQLPDGARRIANVRKLMRLAREWESGHGTDLHGFVSLLAARAGGGDGTRESEAPVASEGLDAVRLMTIHRAKGLEFKVTCVADLGRLATMRGAPVVRIGRDGQRLGLRIGRPGTGGLVEVLDYAELRSEQAAADASEERRLFYVAMTRAQERLILSGAAHLVDWDARNRNAPIGWIGRALVPDIGARIPEGAFVSGGVRVSFIDEATPFQLPRTAVLSDSSLGSQTEFAALARIPFETPQAEPRSYLPQTLSYTAIEAYGRCGYRFYAERVLGLPALVQATGVPVAEPVGVSVGDGLSAVQRGNVLHELLRELDFGRPQAARDSSEAGAIVARFVASATGARLRGLSNVRREQPFVFDHVGVLITGAFDVLASEGPGSVLIVDYKSDRIVAGADLEALVDERYGVQRTVYALAALSAPESDRVEIVHVFLRDPDRPVSKIYARAELEALRAQLDRELTGPLSGEFPVSAQPGRFTCDGCPVAGLLCSVPLELTRV